MPIARGVCRKKEMGVVGVGIGDPKRVAFWPESDARNGSDGSGRSDEARGGGVHVEYSTLFISQRRNREFIKSNDASMCREPTEIGIAH